MIFGDGLGNQSVVLKKTNLDIDLIRKFVMWNLQCINFQEKRLSCHCPQTNRGVQN